MPMIQPIRIFLLIACVCLLTCLGCTETGDSGHVVGVVKINGQPVEGATITFTPSGGGRDAIAITEPDGSYELTYTPGVKGAKLGNNSVRITTYVEPELDDNDRIVKPAEPEKFPPEYSGGQTTVEVKPGENTFDFDIEADKDSYPPAE